MNPNIKLIRPGGLAVWSFLRIFKYEYKIWERSWVQFPVRPFFAFFSLGESCWSYVRKPAADSKVVYDCWGAVFTIFGDITRYSHMYQHQSTQLKRSDAGDAVWFLTNTEHGLQSQSFAYTTSISISDLNIDNPINFSPSFSRSPWRFTGSPLRTSIYVKFHCDMSESYLIFFNSRLHLWRWYIIYTYNFQKNILSLTPPPSPLLPPAYKSHRVPRYVRHQYCHIHSFIYLLTAEE